MLPPFDQSPQDGVTLCPSFYWFFGRLVATFWCKYLNERPNQKMLWPLLISLSNKRWLTRYAGDGRKHLYWLPWKVMLLIVTCRQIVCSWGHCMLCVSQYKFELPLLSIMDLLLLLSDQIDVLLPQDNQHNLVQKCAKFYFNYPPTYRIIKFDGAIQKITNHRSLLVHECHSFSLTSSETVYHIH